MIQAALSLVVLFGMGAFAIDYGMLWLSRDQAQTAADAGALAGALAQAYDGPSGSVASSAEALVRSNRVWFAEPGFEILPGPCPADASGENCVRVNVYRNGTAGSTPLPMVFGPVLGIMSQGVRATATAQVGIGDRVRCLKPWAMPDRWLERRPVSKSTWGSGDRFQRYVESGRGRGSLLPPPRDRYDPPSSSDEGTGLTLSLDLGRNMELTIGEAFANDPLTPGLLLPLVLDGPNTYAQNMSGCNSQLVNLGENRATDLTATDSQTAAGLLGLINADPTAVWDVTNQRVVGSCAPACAPISPRLVALAVFDVDRYQLMRASGVWAGCPGGLPCVNIVNFVGFFIDDVISGGVDGFLTKYPGVIASGSSSLLPDSSFLPAITLVR